ncbi:AbrB/MazE/SpoVT family DNA-binding domain-containing protein [Candidatus Bathyarchaeota archaeon]|nr:AbrB/MazE/SpoVT family DNA-binding domain-containing protein [Candidatus Bathyarchaeota archaeon]
MMEVTVREKGRITIPAPLRESLGLKEGDRLEVTVERRAIVLRPKRTVSSAELRGIIGPMEIDLEEIEEAPGREII